MNVPVRRAAVYWIPDEAVELPPTTRTRRNMHARRTFLVCSNDERNTEDDWPIVQGFPLSTAGHLRTEYDVKVAANECGLRDHSWVQVALLQPIAKTNLLDRIGQISANRMDEVVRNHLLYIGVI